MNVKNSFSLELNIPFIVKVAFKWEKLEKGKEKLERLEKRAKELRKRLEEKNKEANFLKKDIEELLKLLKEIDKQRNEVLVLASDFKKIARDFCKAHEEIYQFYLKAKSQHKEYIEGLMRSFEKFWEAYCEIICDDCLTRLELILKRKKLLDEPKKLT
ncbi:MAG: hypothetical protein I3273_07995 [Candidatus Moeniiplasma glomeromycotorum]|nr:hypothetical protein [Candidatus Moeniiplasma glomeromycotorum]MCE8168495.1 hypothetical protein [Candidatus Moeniiplasma glomeromycotorum]MCE8170018.1 hypothetical protein [Candidatus Moeniiplasma glomeromycotorum]